MHPQQRSMHTRTQAHEHTYTHTSHAHTHTHTPHTHTHTHTQHARTHTQCHTPGRRSICICVMLVTSVTQPSFSPLPPSLSHPPLLPPLLSPSHHSLLPYFLSSPSSALFRISSFSPLCSHLLLSFLSLLLRCCVILSLPLHLSLASPSSSPSSSCFSSSASALSASSATQMQCCDSKHEVWQSSPRSSVLSRPYLPSPSPICARPPTRSSALAETASRARPLNRCVDNLITSVCTRQSITAHLLLPQRRLW